MGSTNEGYENVFSESPAYNVERQAITKLSLVREESMLISDGGKYMKDRIAGIPNWTGLDSSSRRMATRCIIVFRRTRRESPGRKFLVAITLGRSHKLFDNFRLSKI